MPDNDIEQGGAPTTPDGANIDAAYDQGSLADDGALTGAVENETEQDLDDDVGEGDADLPGVTASGAE